MKYICLRNCFVNSRFHHQGETYELSDDVRKSEKNFRLVEEPAPAPAPEKAAPVPKTKPAVIPKGMFWCGRCQMLHLDSKKIGQRHLKYKVEPEPVPELEPKLEDIPAEVGSPTAIAEAKAKADAEAEAKAD